VLVKASYFPNWQVSGAEGPWRVSPNLMVVVPTSEEVTLEFGTTWVEWLAWAITGFGVVGLVLLVRAGPIQIPPDRSLLARLRRGGPDAGDGPGDGGAGGDGGGDGGGGSPPGAPLPGGGTPARAFDPAATILGPALGSPGGASGPTSPDPPGRSDPPGATPGQPAQPQPEPVGSAPPAPTGPGAAS
jgi:hypothetical protein